MKRPANGARRASVAVRAMIVATLMAACAHQTGSPQGFSERIVQGDPFRHRVFSNSNPSSGTLHVYIEGDGRAWANRTTISRDPTPRRPLMLRLMSLDPYPSVYLGRPCYFGLAEAAECNARLWTSHRYSPEVVSSLQHAIEALVAERAYQHVVLFGHSGGGTLATMLASRIPKTRGLVTIAPNLDVAAWTALHDYSPLEGSLDPARTGDFPSGIYQVHWLGSNDRIVPPRLLGALWHRYPGARVRIADGFDHGCCWSRIWPGQLNELAALLGEKQVSSATSAAAEAGGPPRPDSSEEYRR